MLGKVVFRLDTRYLLGPLELRLEDGKAFYADRSPSGYVHIHASKQNLTVVELSRHRVLPLDGWSSAIGQIDFSSDELFLKRALKDLKKITAGAVENTILTDKLISRYCASFKSTELDIAQRSRLMRLKNMTTNTATDLRLSAEAIDDLLSMEAVAGAIADEKLAAARAALDEKKLELAALDGKCSQKKLEAQGHRRRDSMKLKARTGRRPETTRATFG